MRLQEFQVEDSAVTEGPILNKIGTGIGKAVGGVAKAAGAVAGGIAGIGQAVKKGYQAGKTTVGAGGDEPAASAAAPAKPTTATTSAAPAAAPAAATTTVPKSKTAFGRLSQAAAGQDPDDNATPTSTINPSSAAPAVPSTNKPQASATPAATNTASISTPKPQKKDQSVVVSLQDRILKLPVDDQRQMLALLQKDSTKPAAAKTPKAKPAAAKPTVQPPAAKSVKQRDTQGKFIGKNAPRPAPKPNQAEIEADRERLGVGGSESTITTSNDIVRESNLSSFEKFKVAGQAFKAGLENPFGNTADISDKSDKVQSTDTADPSGIMPVTLINRVNQLTDDQKADLYLTLKRKTRR